MAEARGDLEAREQGRPEDPEGLQEDSGARAVRSRAQGVHAEGREEQTLENLVRANAQSERELDSDGLISSENNH